MIDRATIKVKSGQGGNGSISGRREKYVPFGGPDGGDGGNGGSVYVRSESGTTTLLAFRYRRRFVAGDGEHGSGRRRHGRKGDDVDIVVPTGTELWQEGNRSKKLADLARDGDRVMIARGGRGGRGNTHFASSTNRFPLLAEEGEKGEELVLRLELKLLADVGIVGAPNVGKSSLLSAVSAARPKIAGYPFTTLEPVLGVVEHHGDGFVMVDVPGLIEGAHKGVGLGDEFLRHVERTRVLVHVLDGTVEDPMEEYRKIREEIGLFDRSLLEKPEIVAVNKIDVPEVELWCDEVRERLEGKVWAVHCISATARVGLGALLDDVVGALREEHASQDELASDQKPVDKLLVLRPKPVDSGRPTVRKIRGKYVVSARKAERVAGMVDRSNRSAILQFREYLQRLGVERALEVAGISPGDIFVVGRLELEWG